MSLKNKKWYDIKASNNAVSIDLYGEIGGWGITASEFKEDFEYYAKGATTVDVHINSEGGSVFEGLAIFNLLNQSDKTITVYVDGLAASMASLIAMAGDVIIMPENALMMIHNPRMGTYGESGDFEKAKEVLDTAKRAMLSAYTQKTGKSEQEISDIMDYETWFTGKEAVEAGFADQLEKPLDMAASLKAVDLSKYDDVPALANLLNSQPAGKQPLKPSQPSQKGETGMTEEEKKALLDKAKKEAVQEAMQAEAKRREAVQSAFAGIEDRFAEQMQACLNDMSVTADAAKDKVVALLKQTEEHTPISARIMEDEKDKFFKGATAAIAAKAGLGEDDGRNEFRGMSMQELARVALQRSHQSTAGLDRMSLVGSALTTSDFGNVLSNVAQKAMLKGYEEAGETFSRFTSKGSLPDFKGAERVDIGTFPSLQEVREGAEYKQMKISDRAETIKLATYGGMFSISRQAIINDDLSVFTRIPQKMGRAAIRTIGDLVFAQLRDNPKMADGKALFHGDHKNIATGAMETAFIDKLRQLIALQKEGEARLGITPKYLLVPTSLRGLATQIIESEYEIAGNKDKTAPNYVRGLLEVIDDARLETTGNVYVYELADQAMFDTIEVAYLDGQDRPYLEQQNGWSTDGAEFKVRIDAGVKALDYRTMARGQIQ